MSFSVDGNPEEASEPTSAESLIVDGSQFRVGYFWTLWHPVQLSEEPGNKGVTQSVSLFLGKAENSV